MKIKTIFLALCVLALLFASGCNQPAPPAPTPTPAPAQTPTPKAELKCVLDNCFCDCAGEGEFAECEAPMDCKALYGLTDASCEAVSGKCQFKAGFSKTPLKPTPVLPLKLSYEMASTNQNGEKQTVLASYYFDKAKECNGKDAIIGIVETSQAGQEGSAYSKMTVYLDDGRMAISNMSGKPDLAFDKAVPTALQLDLVLTLNSLFASAGKNFNTDAVWTEEEIPTILKGVTFFSNPQAEISIKKKGDSKGIVPCTNFELLFSQGGPGGEGIVVCVADKSKEILLPYVVSVTMPEGSGITWTLTEAKKEKTDITYYPQCLEPVVCTAVADPLQADRDACTALGGSMDTVRDNRNCVTGWQCFTERDRAISELQNWGPEQCRAVQPGEALIQAVLDCRAQNKQRSYTQSANGCVTEVKCQ
ncbi:MAG: hypothetical protein NT067_00320 [Candidatus Diapherotrites archaeon]|nr:hypothetical protein [Candidatus Diapherotrites archaeon]